MKIEVTNDDIQRGEPCEPLRCPVALAVTRATGACGDDLVIVDYDSMYTRVCGIIWKASLPMDIKEFIRAFDAGESVVPSEFNIEVL